MFLEINNFGWKTGEINKFYMFMLEINNYVASRTANE